MGGGARWRNTGRPYTGELRITALHRDLGGIDQWVNSAQCHFVVGGLLIGFSNSNSPKVRKMSESGRIIPLKKRIWG